MEWKPGEKQAARLGAFVTALLLGASVAFWTLHWPSSATVPSAAIDLPLTAQAMPGANASAVASLLGGGNPVTSANEVRPVATISRFKLIGVVARSSGQGSAIIAVDGLPPKSFKVGAPVADGLVLQAVGPRRATLTSGPDGAVAQTLEIPASTATN